MPRGRRDFFSVVLLLFDAVGCGGITVLAVVVVVILAMPIRRVHRRPTERLPCASAASDATSASSYCPCICFQIKGDPLVTRTALSVVVKEEEKTRTCSPSQ